VVHDDRASQSAVADSASPFYALGHHRVPLQVETFPNTPEVHELIFQKGSLGGRPLAAAGPIRLPPSAYDGGLFLRFPSPDEESGEMGSAVDEHVMLRERHKRARDPFGNFFDLFCFALDNPIHIVPILLVFIFL
jgi:hypothetical protein